MPYLTGNSIPAAHRCRQVSIPDDLFLLIAVNGALYDLTLPESWEQYGSVTPAESAAAMSTMLLSYFTSECDMASPGQSIVTFWHAFSAVDAGSAIVYSAVASQFHAGVWGQSPAAINNAWRSAPALLLDGAYTMHVLHTKNSGYGILTLDLVRYSDNVAVDSDAIDMYAPALAINQITNRTYAVPATAMYYLRGSVASKDPASTGYSAFLSMLQMYRTSQ